MTILLLTFVSLIALIIGKHVFKKWFNHISAYVAIWYVNLALYEARLMSYIDLKPFAWQVIIFAFVFFILGALIVYFAKRSLSVSFRERNSNVFRSDQIFFDNGKLVKLIILFSGLIGLFDALFHWHVLINKYDGLAGVFLHANEIYALRVEGKIEGIIPYLLTIPFVGVFFSGILIAYTRKFSFLPLIPLLAIIIKDMASFGRANMLFAIFLFLASFILYSHSRFSNNPVGRFRFRIKLGSIFLLIFLVIFIGSNFVRSSRGAFESFSASSRTLDKFKGGFLISPSLYLYLSSHVGVLSQYLEKDYYNGDHLIGERTFQPFYNFLSKFDLVESPGFYENGYFIPMWTNTSTYLRHMHEDFGVFGLVFGPFFLGFLASLFWFKYYESFNLIYLTLLSYLIVLILYSFMTVYSRTATFTVSLILCLFLVRFLQYRKPLVLSPSVKS